MRAQMQRRIDDELAGHSRMQESTNGECNEMKTEETTWKNQTKDVRKNK